MDRLDPVIVVHRLSKRFGDVVAVDAISFTVAAGSTTALLGANGAGKTTTLAMLLGLLLPTEGEIRIFGEELGRDRYRLLARMNFSSPYVDLPQRLSVAQNLALYARLYGLSRPRRRIAELARELGLEPLLDRPYGALSAGQKTRVMLAKAMLNAPELLLLDEPTASLDPDTADWVRSYLSGYARCSGAAILMASHNMLEVERLCDQVLIMRDGRIVDRGSPDELKARRGRQTLEEAFLDVVRRGDDPREAAE